MAMYPDEITEYLYLFAPINFIVVFPVGLFLLEYGTARAGMRPPSKYDHFYTHVLVLNLFMKHINVTVSMTHFSKCIFGVAPYNLYENCQAIISTNFETTLTYLGLALDFLSQLLY